ncbi:PDR/VanB family oxidoreductase [Nocardia bovistercoris]|uniref:Oxidoreductase n=1 Tax=Nocardia bovistercoris TaxID=2785916 RepID=A0A931IAV9_9NOCA|nr:PDR/VanB family oxidoreductase [Nocardia bovistercoris]MBH0776515.1 oxidoreductase [Nocardia bovistercoris]
MTDLPVRITARSDEATGVFALELAALDGAELPPWSPGAHIDVAVGQAGVRQYSLCGEPGDRTRWRIAVLHEPDGRGGSDLLFRTAHAGAELAVSPPRNNFELESRERYVFIAGGIGITPILPMMAAARASGASWRLYYGGRTREHMAFAEHITARYPEARLLPQDAHGLLPLAEIMDENGDAAVYCCGPEPLLTAVESEGARRGVAVRTERFVPRLVDSAEDLAFEVKLADGRTLRVGARQSIVDVLESAGVPVVTSCREGTCGSCETPVLGGAIEHRDSILSAEERERGDTMMLCVSRARGDLLVLDI